VEWLSDFGIGGYDNRVQENAQYHRELDALATSLGLQTATSKTVISALSIPDSIDVLFLLSVPSAFKDTLLASACLLLYTPSHEHFGIVPVEAMHAGLPVLAVNTGGPLETIVDGKTGWLRPADAVEDWTEIVRKVLHEFDQKVLAEMGRVGRTRVEREFSRRAMGDRLEDEIRDMFAAQPRNVMHLWHGLALLGVVGSAAAILAALFLR
jgi:alpha-1,3/alpha-1,6-mannosyltransferase